MATNWTQPYRLERKCKPYMHSDIRFIYWFVAKCLLRYRNIDICIGGRSITDSSISTDAYTATVYDYDSAVWCVRHVQVAPIWLNMFHIFNGFTVVICIFALFHFVVGLMFIFVGHEGLNIDFYACVLFVFQMTLCQPIIYNLKKLPLRIGFGIGLYCGMIVYTSFIAFYTVSIQSRFEFPRIATLAELIDHDYHLAGDTLVRNAVQKTNFVGFIAAV